MRSGGRWPPRTGPRSHIGTSVTGGLVGGDEASEALIHRSRRFRKMFGGTMRQSGILAGAALYALDHILRPPFHRHGDARDAQLVDGRVDPTIEDHVLIGLTRRRFRYADGLCWEELGRR